MLRATLYLLISILWATLYLLRNELPTTQDLPSEPQGFAKKKVALHNCNWLYNSFPKLILGVESYTWKTVVETIQGASFQK